MCYHFLKENSDVKTKRLFKNQKEEARTNVVAFYWMVGTTNSLCLVATISRNMWISWCGLLLLLVAIAMDGMFMNYLVG